MGRALARPKGEVHGWTESQYKKHVGLSFGIFYLHFSYDNPTRSSATT